MNQFYEKILNSIDDLYILNNQILYSSEVKKLS